MVLLLLPFLSYAQKEASIWHLGNENVLDFNSNPVAVKSDVFNHALSASSATYADKSGNLMFYANLFGVFNSDGSLMQYGKLDKIIGNDMRHIIPKPGQKDSYYVFYIGSKTGVSGNFEDMAVMYAVVDYDIGSKKGIVREKDVILYSDIHGYYTISAQCENGNYWLVGEINRNPTDNSDKIVAYLITPEGIADTPVVSEPVSIGHAYHLKLSPKGNKLAFNYSGQGEGFGLVDFDINTGEISNLVVLESSGWTPEFSPSGEMLYLSSYFSQNTILQYTLSSGEPKQIIGSKTVLYKGESRLWGAQLAPDGKIYITQSFSFSPSLAIIHYPERSGVACQLEMEAIPLPSASGNSLPMFSTDIFYDSPIKPDAGPDKEVCAGQPAPIGGSNITGYSYQWHPSEYLSDPQSPNPTFMYTGQGSEAQEFTYTLTVDDGVCDRADEMKITVMPIPQSKITGSQSVCPAVEGVAYSTVSKPDHTYRWTVTGGQVMSGQGTAAITVNWGATNAAAQVAVTAISAFGCESKPTVLPVRINVELKPETPQGPESVCLNKKAGNTYEVVYTNGSLYTWGISGGEITDGQGSSKVNVNWSSLGRHKIWIQEKSVTADTVCYGSSDTLQVHVYQDPALLNLDYISIDPNSADDRSNIAGHIEGVLLNSETVAVMRRAMGSATWVEVMAAKKDSVVLTDDALRADDEVYEYQLLATNDCDELITSTVHRTIRLTVQADYATDQVTLNWSAYEGWPAGVARYEVWGKLDDEQEYKLVQQLDNSTFNLANLDGTAGFIHRYRIKAVAVNATWESWSNEAEVTFEHKLVIPNIFTPNGDGFNDTFYIPKIELYPENELTILSRTGKEILRLARYNSTWNGDNVVAGTYYYQLYIKRLDKFYKGWVEIVR